LAKTASIPDHTTGMCDFVEPLMEKLDIKQKLPE
jgi:hypothetical protein